MAEITLSSGSQCRPFRSPWGAFPIRTFRAISTATIAVGRMLTLNWTGSTSVSQVLPAAASSHYYGVGIAASSFTFVSSAVAGGDVSVWECNPNVEFRAYTRGAALASSIVGFRRQILWDSTLGITLVDLAGSTGADWRVIVTGLIGIEGDTGGEVSFRFISRLGENNGSSVVVTSTTPVLAFFG